VLRLLTLEARVDRDENGADEQGSERRHHPPVGVGCPDGDAVAGVDAVGERGAGERRHLLLQLRERETDVAGDDGLDIGGVGCCGSQHGGHGEGKHRAPS